MCLLLGSADSGYCCPNSRTTASKKEDSLGPITEQPNRDSGASGGCWSE